MPMPPAANVVRLAAFIVLVLTHAASAAERPTLLVTADTEGHLGPCAECPAGVGHGGMAKRATLLADLRRQHPDALLVDAGNALFGGDSAASSGKVIAAALDAAGYDAVNVSFRDFRAGRADTLAALAGTKVPAVSCNVLDAATGAPLFKPFVVREVGGRKVAVIGVTDVPAGINVLPHLKRQLAGVRIDPPAAALGRALPNARAEAEQVVLLYYGSARGLEAILAAHGKDLAAVAVGGLRLDDLPAVDGVAMVAATEHGKSVGRLKPTDRRGEVVPVTPDLVPDPEMDRVVARFATAPEPPPVAATRPASEHTIASSTRPATEPATRPADPSVAVTPPPPVPPTPVPPAMPATPAPVPPVEPAKPTRVAAKQPHEPKGLAGVGLTPEQVDAAVGRGAAFVWEKLRAEVDLKRGTFGDEGYFIVDALALVKAGHHKREPAFDRVLRAYLDQVRPEGLGTYAAGALCMLVEAYGDPRYEPALRRSARYLFEGYGSKGWNYTPKVPEAALVDARAGQPLQVWGGRPPEGTGAGEQWRRATTQPDDQEGDNSIAQYAVMGLQAAARSGVEVPPDTWRFVLDLYRSRQTAAGGWGYVGPSSAESGGLTCAGIYSLAVARHRLGEREPAVDEGVERGLAWLAEHFTVSENPKGGYHYYYLYSLERVGLTLGTEFVGPHEWYPLGAKWLLANQQPDGSFWENLASEGRPDLTTSFAILFLTRSTPKLSVERKPDGPGLLKTALVQPPAPRVYLILDCSGSMMADMGGRPKFDVARQAVADLLKELPDNTQVALRAYGHRKTAIDQGADEDTELVLPMAPLDRQAFADRLRSLRPRGKTPLALSLTQAADDLGKGDGKTDVILLTDGGEDTLPRKNPAEAAEAMGRIKDVGLHVVGFDIGRADWGEQLQSIARRGKGKYWPAGNAAALTAELRAAVLRSPGGYEVRDAAERVVYRGAFGDRRELPAGRYAFVTGFAGKQYREPFWVSPGEPTAVVFDAGKVDVVQAPGATKPTTPEMLTPVANGGGAAATQPVAPRPMFCTECGAKLAPNARFCTNCGKRVP